MNDVLIQNEKKANRIAAKVMFITWIMYTIIYLMNVVGIFIIDSQVMLLAYVLGSVALLIPSLLVKCIDYNAKYFKYFNVICATLFIFVISITLTYHVVVVYVYPIALASLYFSRRMNIIATLLSVIVTVVGQLVSFYWNPLQDLNFPTLRENVIFGIVPRTIMLIATSAIFTMLAERTATLLRKLSGAVKEISTYQHEMITGFATLMEKRDDDTGEHIRRTSKYVELVAREMAARGYYKEILTEEYINNLLLAAPMHDIGKISIPDSILQKPGKLTEEEYAIMQLHAPNGGKIIKETFGHIQNVEYHDMAYDVANYHHEKWNGEGYPEGLKEMEIPLSARIMAIADVFDALSEDRCYRSAMAFDECFAIIAEGRGSSFEPLIVDVFLDIKDKVIEVHESI